MFHPMPVTERIRRIRKTYLSQSPIAKGEMEKYKFHRDYILKSPYFYEGWDIYKNMPNATADQPYSGSGMPTTTLRRAYAEAYALRRSRPIIYDDELIVGQFDIDPDLGDERAKIEESEKAYRSAAPYIGDARSDHLCLDYEILLARGVNGLLDELHERLDSLDFNHTENIRECVEKEDFYKGCIVELEALLDLAERYAAHAVSLAGQADEKRAKELLKIAEVMRHVPANPAKSFREALQSVHFYTFNLGALYPLGRPDQYLIDFYRKDIQDGKLTPAEAQEYIDNFCLLFSTYIVSWAANGFMLGGTDSDGHAVENELTYMLLNSIPHVRMSDPNIGLCVTKDTAGELWRYAVGLILDGESSPQFYNDKAIVDAFCRRGFLPEDAHRYIHSTCVELTVIGKTNMWGTSPWTNLAKIFLEVLFADRTFDSLDEFLDAFLGHLKHMIISSNTQIARLQLERSRNGSEPLRASCLVSDCIKRGKGLYNGGAVYNPVSPAFVGLGNVVDSISTMEEVVFRRHLVSLEELKDILRNDYKGNEKLRQYILNKVPHYGNQNGFCDNLAKRITGSISSACDACHTYRGGIVIPALFSYDTHFIFGKDTMATPDGRHSGDPLADSCGAVQGRDQSGPTALLNSVTSWNNSDFIGGFALNLKINRENLSEDAIGNVISLIRSFLENGGVQIQLNCVDKSVLEDAVAHPENHRDLLVRVGGYSAYFVLLTPKLQQELIERTAYQM